MPGLLPRVASWLSGGLRAWLAPAADPRQAFATSYQRQRELLRSVRQVLAAVGASRGRLEGRMRDARARLPQLEQQARRDLAAGREDLARLALQRRQASLGELAALEGQVREVEDVEQRLALVERRLATHIEALSSRQEVAAARSSAAAAQVRLQEQLAGISDELADLGAALERAEHQAEQMEARASALDQLVDSGILATPGRPAVDAVERQLDQLAAAQALEAQLAALRNGVIRDPAPERRER
jgi:phage shock protein A